VSEPGLPDPGAFGAAFEDFMRAMTEVARRGESPLAARLREHLGAELGELPSTVAQFSPADHANLQLGLDAVADDAEILGFSTPHAGFHAVGLSELVSEYGFGAMIRPGPVQYTDVEVGDGRVVQCVSSGVYLARHEGEPLVLVLARGLTEFGAAMLRVEGLGAQGGLVPAFLQELRAAMREHNVFRGKVISLQADEQRSVSARFHQLAEVGRNAVILPDGRLERLERHALGIARHAERLRAGGRHLKRGVLLHGPPGTGKTLSVTYLLGAMAGRTTVLLTGRGLGLIEQALAIARDLAPATVVLEDVDLVAAERTMPFGSHGALFELLNQMEGLAEDEDLLFVLTTNRPDILEPALAARPGRIDLALEIPLPDAEARGRLLDLYAAGIELDAETRRVIVERTERSPGALFRELVRQAALRTALDERAAPRAADLLAALDELLDDRATLTRRLLGQPGDGGPPGPAFGSMVHALGATGLPMPGPHGAEER
jgi:cell division protease FtsH